MISLNHVLDGQAASDKKQLLQKISQELADISGLDAHIVFERLFQRERLGSTGLGGGIAIPHAKIPGLRKIYGLFVRMKTPVLFDAIDHKPVDLLYVMIAPHEAGADHLQALAEASRKLRDVHVCSKIRGANSAAAIQAILSQDAQPLSQPMRRAA